MSAMSASSGIPVSSRQAGQRRPRRRPGPAGRVERAGDPAERPAVADLGGGLEGLGRAGARAALQRDQVEVAGQDLPELGPPLGRVDPGDQVGSEEQRQPAHDRHDDRDGPGQAGVGQRYQRGKRQRGRQSEQAVADLAGDPALPVLAEQGQVRRWYRQPGQFRRDALGQRARRAACGLRGPAGVQGAVVQARQGRVQPGGRGHEFAHDDEDAGADEDARGNDPQVHRRLPTVIRSPPATWCWSSLARNRPWAGIAPSRYSQPRPAAYSPVTRASTSSPGIVP